MNIRLPLYRSLYAARQISIGNNQSVLRSTSLCQPHTAHCHQQRFNQSNNTATNNNNNNNNSVMGEIHSDIVNGSDVTPKYTMLRMNDDLGSGRILRWYVQVGQHVRAGDVLCDMDTDVAELQYQCQYDGVIGAILFDVNQTVRTDDAIAIQVDNDNDVKYAQVLAQQIKNK